MLLLYVILLLCVERLIIYIYLIHAYTADCLYYLLTVVFGSQLCMLLRTSFLQHRRIPSRTRAGERTRLSFGVIMFGRLSCGRVPKQDCDRPTSIVSAVLHFLTQAPASKVSGTALLDVTFCPIMSFVQAELLRGCSSLEPSTPQTLQAVVVVKHLHLVHHFIFRRFVLFVRDFCVVGWCCRKLRRQAQQRRYREPAEQRGQLLGLLLLLNSVVFFTYFYFYNNGSIIPWKDHVHI